ncbi:MAG: DUF3783 domain-containing protein [Candidatus Hydrothermae bacterium]|nr:DUF3783 domain-containing protein [Candidatus Hydrothermae bacterium]
MVEKSKEYRIIIVHGFSDKEFLDFYNKYKDNKLPPAIFAVTTEHSLRMKLEDLINTLINEHEEIMKKRKGK